MAICWKAICRNVFTMSNSNLRANIIIQGCLEPASKRTMT